MKRKPEIIISKTGPYVAVDVERMAYDDGEVVETKAVMMLCRCGESLNGPFCDGSHTGAGYSPVYAPSISEAPIIRYDGGDIVITYNPCLCSHSGLCVVELPLVFRKNVKPWINPKGASIREIVELIDRCPSGALGYEVAGKSCGCVEREAGITIERKGPFNVQGGILIKDEKHSAPYNHEHYCLCRCGKSEHAPYCDGKHREKGEPEGFENW